MGDAESCLFRQQTREVRKKLLINYRFLCAAASASLTAPATATLLCPSRAASPGTSEPETLQESVPSAPATGPTQPSPAQPGGFRAAATQVENQNHSPL